MSEQIKAIYYPNLTLQLSVTRFGSKKLLEPANPYVKPLTNKKILVRIDMLECLRDVWGTSILVGRDNIYKLVSGDTDDETYRSLLCSYYRTHAAFANYIDYISMFGRQDVPFIKRFVDETRRLLREYSALVDATVSTYAGTKFLLETEEYRWYAVTPVCDLSALKGVTYVK